VKRLRWIVAGYLGLLGASWLVRALESKEPLPRPGSRVVTVGAVALDLTTARPVRIARFDSTPAANPAAPVVVLLHGSPGDHHEVLPLSRVLARDFRVVAPDLPGFGGSSRSIPDYSIRAHARYVLQLLDSLRIQRVHLIGFSMGGGVALNLADLAPARVASLTLLSAIGVQEYELLGDYHLNHLVHGLQLGALWLLLNATPHFGAFDGGMLTIPYARNFYDSDQRPLRGILSRYAGPMLIVQGERDPLVPAAIAAEHARLVPQSELLMLPGNHFMTFREPEVLAGPIERIIARAESGQATLRAGASPARVRAAAERFSAERMPPAQGIGFVVLLLLLAAATLVWEDFTCIAAGLLVSRGTVGYLPATLACFGGIVVGDVLLYGAGRWIGRTALRGRIGLKRASAWLTRRGPVVVLSSRFLPGSRLPTFVAAGILHTRFLPFAGYFLLAAALWTPLLVGIATLYGDAAPMLFASWRRWSLPLVILAGLLLLLCVKLVVPLFSWRGRRLLLSRWRRLTRWEFWPRWAFYPPLVLYILWLGLKHRSLTLFTATNPAIPGGGFLGESKWEILAGLRGPRAGIRESGIGPVVEGNAYFPTSMLIRAEPSVPAKLDGVARWMAQHGLQWPVVLKPDIGERGDGVRIIRAAEELAGYLERAGRGGALLAQEYVGGLEFGIFYYRLPGEATGSIFSITEKRLPTVRGDGRSTLEALILRDERAVCQARLFLDRHALRLGEVPAAGSTVTLGELGTHCRGAAFYDGSGLASPELEAVVEEISKRYQGFWFGRYDVRAESLEALRAGRFRIIELNGVTSEATSIYDPKYRLREAYALLRKQWRIAYAIGARNRAAGSRPAKLTLLLELVRRHRAAKHAHVAD
jgi:pimeloyl-ACP methyl ester carboxylesterase/membrane protein DedA with SNARE-associated domain